MMHYFLLLKIYIFNNRKRIIIYLCGKANSFPNLATATDIRRCSQTQQSVIFNLKILLDLSQPPSTPAETLFLAIMGRAVAVWARLTCRVSFWFPVVYSKQPLPRESPTFQRQGRFLQFKKTLSSFILELGSYASHCAKLCGGLTATVRLYCYKYCEIAKAAFSFGC